LRSPPPLEAAGKMGPAGSEPSSSSPLAPPPLLPLPLFTPRPQAPAVASDQPWPALHRSGERGPAPDSGMGIHGRDVADTTGEDSGQGGWLLAAMPPL